MKLPDFNSVRWFFLYFLIFLSGKFKQGEAELLLATDFNTFRD